MHWSCSAYALGLLHMRWATAYESISKKIKKTGSSWTKNGVPRNDGRSGCHRGHFLQVQVYTRTQNKSRSKNIIFSWRNRDFKIWTWLFFGVYLKAGLPNFENKTMEYLQITRHFYSFRGKKPYSTLQDDETFYVCQSGVELFRKSNRIKKYSLQIIEEKKLKKFSNFFDRK